MNKDILPPEYRYTVFYSDRKEVIAGYPQMAFKIVRARDVEGVITFMGTMGVTEDDIQSIDLHS